METEKNFEELEPEKEQFEEKEPAESMPEMEVDFGVDAERVVGETEEQKRERIKSERDEIEEARRQIQNQFEEKPKKEEVETPKNSDDKKQHSTEKRESGAGIIKNMGIRVGELLGGIADVLRNRVNEFEIERSGVEHLKELEGKPYLLAANHIKPRNILMQAIGLSPDSFVIGRVVREESQRIPNMITNVTGKIRRIPIIGYIDKLWSPFREGVMEGAGFIPVKMRRGEKPGGFNRNFIEKFRGAIERKEPVIIFPQGRWDKDFNPEREFETGAATLAKKYDLPIVPVYVKGGRSWSSKERASVNIGQIINPAEKTKEEITDEIKGSITHLKEVKADANDKTEK